MIRRRQVLPGPDGVVTREMLIEALVSVADFLDFAGGVVSVVTQRMPTNLDGEMVTVGAIVEWRSKVGARPGPGQYEEATTPEPDVEAERPRTRVDIADEALANGGMIDAHLNVIDPGPGAEPTRDNPDGFDLDSLEPEVVDGEPVGTKT